MASLWDEGDIAQAVTKAKNLGAIFIVFVEGENELSADYAKLFTNAEIMKKLQTKNFVAIKIQENSTAHQQFTAIYPHNSTPSIFFIGKNGKPLEVVTENIQVKEFDEKIVSILEKNGINDQSTSSMNINDEEQTSVSSNVYIPTITSGASSAEVSSQIVSESSSELCPEKKIQHARELIEKKREEKRKQEEEAERLREKERRKMGQDVQQMKKWQQDEELKQLKQERDREKRENQAARDRVLAQIAQDKAERVARFSKQGSESSPQISQPSVHLSKSSVKSSVSMLQFRLPDGSSHTHEFQINDSLELVHQYIQNEMNLPFANYVLSTTFPRREFTSSDNSQTLLDLQLVPTAVILILPQNRGIVSSSTSGIIGNAFWWLITPLFSIYDFLVGYLFGRTPSARTVESTASKRSASEVEESSRNLPKRQASDSTVIKRQGNIHRLKDRPDTDDDNNTWNGNSTQQM